MTPVREEQVEVSLGAAATVRLSRRECWELYVLLDDEAPFVRHELSAIRNGRAGCVSLTSLIERQQVRKRLVSRGGAPNGLTAGLRSLAAALAGS